MNRRSFFACCALLSALCAACARSHMDSGTDSSTHWLKACESRGDCGGLDCLCGFCNRACGSDAECRALGSSAVCRSGSMLACTAAPMTCAAECKRDADCSAPGARCSGGLCQQSATTKTGLPGDGGGQPESGLTSVGPEAAVADGNQDAASSCRITPRPECTTDGGSCDWAAQQLLYRGCSNSDKGVPWLAHCGSYNAVEMVGTDSGWTDFYDAKTGQLAGRTYASPGTGKGCMAYDASFVPPSSCAAIDGECPCRPSAPYTDWPMSWHEALTANPCAASRCGNYDAFNPYADSSWRLYYAADTGALVGAAFLFPDGRPPECHSYTPLPMPLFALPTDPCIPLGDAGQCNMTPAADAGSIAQDAGSM